MYFGQGFFLECYLFDESLGANIIKVGLGIFDMFCLSYRLEITSITASRPCMSPPGNGYLASTSGVRTSERRERFLVSRAKQ